MIRRLLVPDQRFAVDHGLADVIELFPRPSGVPPKWHLSFEKNPSYTREIVCAKDRLAALFSDKVYSRTLPYRKEAMESFFLSLGYAMTFVIGDRLLRVNALFGEVSPADVVLPDVPYRHDPKATSNDFVYQKAQDNPYFNQWIVNALLPRLERMPLRPVPGSLPERALGETNPMRKIQRKLNATLHGAFRRRIVFELAKHGRDLPCEYDALQIQNLLKRSTSFFWPRGRLCPIQTTLLRGDEKLFSPSVTRHDFARLREEVAEIFRDLLMNSGETIHLPEESFLAIAALISELLPSVVVEEVRAHADRFLQEMSQFRGDYYFCGATYSGYDTAFHTFAAKELGKKILSTQHSGWGGYLADGALISELLIAGCNDYVTFGWTNKDPNVSNWIDRPVVLPSPFLSELERKSSGARRRRSKTELPERRNVLLSTGFVYRFPSVYNSFLRVDTVSRWAEIIGDVLRKLARADVNVTLIMYHETIAKLHRPILEGWLAIDPARIVEYPDHNVRVRHMMESGRFAEKFDAVIWDLPAGGFSEAIYCDIPTFSLWNTRLIRSLPFADPFISDLLKAGVFFSTGDEIAETMQKFYTVPGWYHSEPVQEPIRAFARNFLLADRNWQEPWAAFLKSI